MNIISNLKLSRRYFQLGKPMKNAMPSSDRYVLYKEFDKYQRNNYPTVPVKCLCRKDNSYLISTVDREGLEYHLVICRSCGLIRAREYWDEKSVNHYYSNWYRKKYGGEEDPERFYKNQATRSKLVWDFVKKELRKFEKPYVVADIGGGVGGILDLFKSDNNCYLFDYNKLFLKKANEMGIKTIEGGINNLDLIEEKPDLVILSHVLEHFTNVHKEFESLKKHLKIGTLIYIELPGIDSLVEGRRGYDFLGDLHWPHVFYFSRRVLNNLMGRYGFKCLRSNTLISGLYEYTGQTVELENHHDDVCSLIMNAEIKRKLGLFYIRKFIGKILPRTFTVWIKKRLKLTKSVV